MVDRIIVQDFVDSLNSTERFVFVLVFLEQRTRDEIADLMFYYDKNGEIVSCEKCKHRVYYFAKAIYKDFEKYMKKNSKGVSKV